MSIINSRIQYRDQFSRESPVRIVFTAYAAWPASSAKYNPRPVQVTYSPGDEVGAWRHVGESVWFLDRYGAVCVLSSPSFFRVLTPLEMLARES